MDKDMTVDTSLRVIARVKAKERLINSRLHEERCF